MLLLSDAIAAYSDRYKHVEREARREKRGMWSHVIRPQGTTGTG